MDSLLAIPVFQGHLGSWLTVFVHEVFFCYSGYFPRIESPKWNYLVKGMNIQKSLDTRQLEIAVFLILLEI